jgi:RecA/RadA recombinase
MSMNLNDSIRNALMAKTKEKKSKQLRTGCTVLDLTVGGEKDFLGFRAGKIHNIVGDKSAGKSFLASEIVARSYSDYGEGLTWNYDDAEEGYTFNSKILYGFEMMKDKTLRSEKIEDLDVNINRFASGFDNEVGIYMLDSLDGLSNKELEERSEKRKRAAEAGRDFKEGTYGTKTAKFLSQEFFRTKARLLSDTDVSLFFISQVRENMDGGMCSPKFIRAGGKALDHYCHTVLWLYPVRKLTKEGRVIGWVIKAKTEKSKTPRPYRECLFSIYFDYGVDNIGSNLDFLFDLRGDDFNLKAAANNIVWDGKETEKLSTVKAWLEEHHWLEKVREWRKKVDGTNQLSLDAVKRWVEGDPEKKKAYQSHFGSPESRDELIARIEEDPKLEKELERRVIEKWETIEEKIATKRKRKYS